MLPGTQGRSKFPRPAAADGKATKVALGPVPLHLFLPVGSRRKVSGCGSTPACQLQHGDVAFLFIFSLPTTCHLLLLCPPWPVSGDLPSPFVWCKQLAAPSRGISILSVGPWEWSSSASRVTQKHFAVADKRPLKAWQ